mgnify:CR=1 FL=1
MPDFPITPQIPVKRNDLEYPTENINFIYLMMIGKATYRHGIWTLTNDDFIDKFCDVYQFPQDGEIGLVTMRYNPDTGDHYEIDTDASQSTADYILYKRYADTWYTLGTEAVDLDVTHCYAFGFSISGSSLKALRDDGVKNVIPSTVVISVTDTDIASGKIGGQYATIRAFTSNWRVTTTCSIFTMWLRAPITEIPQPSAIVEYPVKEDTKFDVLVGKEVKRISPDMPENIIEDEEYGKVNTLAVTWGAIDYKGESTMLCAIYEQSPEYLRKDRVLTHIEYAKKKNLMVIKTPRTLREVNEIHRKITSTRREMMITVNELAYHLLGKPELEIDAVADFYERELLDLNRIKKVPTWELHRTLNRWEKLGKRYKRLNAIKKLARVRKR